MENNKILTEDMIPKGYYWAAVEPDGVAYAFKEIPKLSVDYNSWESNEGSGHVIIGKNFDTSNWKKSLICFDLDFKVFFDDLTVDDIPDGYNYIAIDSFSSVYAYINEPVKSYDYWEKVGEEIYKQIGVHLGKFDWEDSLVSRVSDTKFKTLTEVDIPEGFKYAVITKAGTAVATVVAPRLTKWGWDFREGELKVIGEGYDFTDWQNSFISRGVIMESNPTKLTADDIPEGYNYAAVSTNGVAYVYENEPTINENIKHWSPNGRYEVIGNGYDATDWRNSLVSREIEQKPELKKLTVADIPEGYGWAAVNQNGSVYAYKNKPEMIFCGWICTGDYIFLGEYNRKNWQNSLVSKEGATFNGAISSFDYSKFNNVSFFDYGKLNSNSFPIDNQMEKPTTEISNLSSKFSSFDTTFLKVAEVIAERSKSTRLKVGAVLVKDKRIISTGYNGLVSGVEPDVLEDENGVTKKEVIHAELNCIISCARNGVSCEGATLYLTHSPCESCAALIAQSGIKKVIFKEYYRDLSGIEKLKSYGVEVI